MESGEGVKPADFRPHEYTSKPTDDEGQIIESVHHISSPSARQDEIPDQNLESRDDLSEDTDVIRLEKHGIELRIPPNEAYRAKDVAVEPTLNIQPELVLKETEAIIKPAENRLHEYTSKPTDDEGQITESVHHISSPSARQNIIPDQNLESRDDSSKDADVIRLEKHGIEVRIPPNEAYRAKDVTVEPIHEIPSELVLKDTEVIISVGLRMLPSGATFDIPVKVTMPHRGIFTRPEAAEVVTYYRKSASENFTAIPSTNGSLRCVVRHRDLDVFMDHFFEIWIVAVFKQILIGKRVICTPYIPVSTPKNDEHMLFVHVRDENIRKVEEQHGYMAPITGEQFFVEWGCGELRITCKESTPVEDEVTTLQESQIRFLTEHKVMFKVDARTFDRNKVILQFILKQRTSKQLLVPMFLEGKTDSASQGPSASTSAGIPPQDASEPAGELPTSKSSGTVSDGKLNNLAADVPPDKYYDLSFKLGIEYNEAACILMQHGSNFKGALRKCLSIWKNKTGGGFTKLKEMFEDVNLGGVWKKYMN
eukprot:XP_011667375.1 PREDICTED: uncharacterized protein LOC105439733 [Strongylocentrotus purpuratus]